MENKIKKLRVQKGLTQENLGNKFQVSRRTIISLETGKATPSLALAFKIAKYFDVNIDELFYNKNAPNTLKFIDLFCGIGGFRYAAEQTLERLSVKSNCVFSCDIDTSAQDSYEANFSERPRGDITQINARDIPDHDILFAGFPCQPFSIMGLGKGFADIRGTLFFDIARIIKAKKPTAFVLENVKRLVSHSQGETLKIIINELEDLGYNVEFKVLNALNCGLPQKRERVIIVGSLNKFKMRWPKAVINPLSLSDILEKNVANKYFVSEQILSKRKNSHKSKLNLSVWHENKSGNITSNSHSCALRAGASYNYLLVNGERRFTPRELLRLQGFPDSFKIVVSDTQLRKQTGNAVPVNMISLVLDSFVPEVFNKNKHQLT